MIHFLITWYLIGLLGSVVLLAFMWWEGDDIRTGDLREMLGYSILGPIWLGILFVVIFIDNNNFPNKTIFKGRGKKK